MTFKQMHIVMHSSNLYESLYGLQHFKFPICSFLQQHKKDHKSKSRNMRLKQCLPLLSLHAHLVNMNKYDIWTEKKEEKKTVGVVSSSSEDGPERKQETWKQKEHRWFIFYCILTNIWSLYSLGFFPELIYKVLELCSWVPYSPKQRISKCNTIFLCAMNASLLQICTLVLQNDKKKRKKKEIQRNPEVKM